MNPWVTAAASVCGLLYAIAVSRTASIRMIQPAERVSISLLLDIPNWQA